MPHKRVPVHPYFKKSPHPAEHHIAARAAGAGPWSVPDLCKAYQWPSGLEHNGVIAIVELGGGWLAKDVAAFFASLGQPAPTIIDISVDGTKNTPGDDADAEVALDIQVAAAAFYAATGRAATLRIYWAQDIALAVRAAAKDGCDVCSISWGADEADWGLAAANDMEAAAIEATAAGMVVFAASGDNDSGDGGDGGAKANVDLPAGCPHVIGCGGTYKSRSAETVWNNNPGKATGSGGGGGFSTFFPKVPWQLGAPTPPKNLGRLVPDISANADPNSGYEILLNGQREVVGGTSAVAPLFAGLFAALGSKLGFVSQALWQDPTGFADITVGDNGGYKALTGPDPCTGLGAPIGLKLAALFLAPAAPPVAGDPPHPAPSAPTLEDAKGWVSRAMKHLPTHVSRQAAEACALDALTKHWPKS